MKLKLRTRTSVPFLQSLSENRIISDFGNCWRIDQSIDMAITKWKIFYRIGVSNLKLNYITKFISQNIDDIQGKLRKSSEDPMMFDLLLAVIRYQKDRLEPDCKICQNLPPGSKKFI